MSGIPPHITSVTLGDLTFDACFDSGNCARIEQTGKDEYSLWTNPDAAGTAHEKQYKVWFSFAVRGAAKGRVLTFVVYNMNNLGKLFRHDMRPVYRSLPSRPKWSRLQQPTSQTGTEKGSNCFTLTFKHKCESGSSDTLFFAFCFPLSYAETMARLAHLDHLFGLPPAAVPPPGAGGAGAGARGGGGGGFGAAAIARKGSSSSATAAPSAASAAAAVHEQHQLVDAAAALGLDDDNTAAGGGGDDEAAGGAPANGGGAFGGGGNGASTGSSSSSSSGFQGARAVVATAGAAKHAPASVHAAALAAASRLGDGSPPPSPFAADVAGLVATAAVGYALRMGPVVKPPHVYYHRELLTRSLDGRRVDVITISGTNGMLAAVEDTLEAYAEGLLPEGGERARRFENKPVFFMSARVHPGETPASHVLDGLLEFLMRPDDPRAAALRERYAAKLAKLVPPLQSPACARAYVCVTYDLLSHISLPMSMCDYL